jgi:ABC-type nitrate/sulfonate/bicarbonate transport system substrate-binding protein
MWQQWSRTSTPRRRRSGAPAVFGLLLAMILAACGTGTGGSDADASEPDVAAAEPAGDAVGSEAGECEEISTWEYMSRTQPSDPLLAYFTVGQEMGYFDEYCVDFVPVTVEAGESTVRSGVDTNNTVTGADRLITLHRDDLDEPLVGFMNYTPNYHAVFAVPPDSPLEETADLEGARIAIFTTAVSYYDTSVAELRQLGMDHEEGDYEWIEIPQGAPSANALVEGDVDAVVIHDTGLIGIEDLIGELKILEHSAPGFEALPGPFLAMHKDNFEQRPEEVSGLVRGFLKSWAFVDENLEAAVRMHIDKFPELVGTSESEDEAIERVSLALSARHANNQAPEWKPDGEYMYFYPEAFEIYLEILEIPEDERQRIMDSTYTNEFVEAAWEGLDLEEVREQARQF